MSLDGSWYNEHGSEMQISIAPDGTTLTGTYRTRVGLANGLYPLVGYCDPRPDAMSTALGFTVIWNNASGDANSVTSWCGQYQTIDGCETITALWLLTQETDPSDNWQSTMVGEDCFIRHPAPDRQGSRPAIRRSAPFPQPAMESPGRPGQNR
jgi:hypothetical protein